jgi:hypothetical protein
MSGNCALCGQDDPKHSLHPPSRWIQHFREERDMSPPVGHIEIPLCWDCFNDVDHLRLQQKQSPHLSEKTREDLQSVIGGMLDSVDLDALNDVTIGPS